MKQTVGVTTGKFWLQYILVNSRCYFAYYSYLWKHKAENEGLKQHATRDANRARSVSSPQAARSDWLVSDPTKRHLEKKGVFAGIRQR